MITRRLIAGLLTLTVAVGSVTLVAGALTAGAAAAQDPTATPAPTATPGPTATPTPLPTATLTPTLTPLPRGYVIRTDAYVLPYGVWVNLHLETREGNPHGATVTQWEFHDPTGSQAGFTDWQLFTNYSSYAASSGNAGRFVVPDATTHPEWAFRAQITDPQGRALTVGPTPAVQWKAADEQPIVDLRAAMDRIPGGGFAAVFLVPVVFAGSIAVGSRSPLATTIAAAGSMGVMVWITGVSPLLWVLVALTAAAGVLVSIQLGFGRTK